MKQQLLWLLSAVAFAGCGNKQAEIKPEIRELIAAVYT